MMHKKGRFTRLLAGFLAIFLILSGPLASAAENEITDVQEASAASAQFEIETENPPEATEPTPEADPAEENPPEAMEPTPEADPAEENPPEATEPTPEADPAEETPPEATEPTPDPDPAEETPAEATEPTPDLDSAEEEPAGVDESDAEPSDPDSEAAAEQSDIEDGDDAAVSDGEEKVEDEEELTLEEFQRQIREINNTRALDTVPDTMYVEPSDTNGVTERLYIDVSRVTKTTSSSWSSKTFTYEVTCSICLPDTALNHIEDCKFSWDGLDYVKATVYDTAGNTLQSNVVTGTRSVPAVGQTERYYFSRTQNGQTFKIYYTVTTDSVPTAMWIKAKDNGLSEQVDVEITGTVDSMDGDVSVRTYTGELLLPGTANLEKCFLTWNGELKAAVIDDENGPYKSGKCPIPAIGETKTYVFSQGRRRVEFVVTAYDALPDTMWVELSSPEQPEPTNPEQPEVLDPEQPEAAASGEGQLSNTNRIYLTKNGNSYTLELPFGVPEGCMFHWNGALTASVANDPNGPYASGECPVPGESQTKTYTFTNTKGDRVSFTVTTSVIKPKLRVEPSATNGIPAAIDVFVSGTKTSTTGSGNSKKTTYTYTSGLYLPGNANVEACVLTWDGSISATVGGTACGSGCPIPDVGSTTSYTFVNGRTTWVYNITTYQGSSGVPAVFIDIDESKGTIAAMDGDPCHDTECSGRINIDGTWYDLTKMKGRGNYTWEKAQDKKPYNITLGTAINFPGVSSGATKKWSFLAEIFDPSLLCNRSGYWLAAQLGVGQSTTSADVWMNGEYQGCYTVTPKTDSFVPSKGFMIEEDNYLEDPVSAGGDPQFTLVGLNEDSGWSSCYNRITVKEMGGSWTAESIQSWLQDAWDAVQSADGKNAKGKYYYEYIDLTSFAKMYLLHEYVKSYDICAGSLLFYCSGDGETDKLYAGPLWDLDNAMGSTYSNNELGSVADRRSGSGDFIRYVNEDGYKTSFYKALGNHSEFMAEVSRQYSYHSSAFNGLPDVIDSLRGNIEISANMNHAKVEKINNDNHSYSSNTPIDGQTYYATTSWSAYVTNLKTYAAARSAWFQGSAWFHTFDGAACPHRYTEVIDPAPTCTSEGTATYTCELCGESYQVTRPKLPHDYQLNSDDGHYYCSCCGARAWDVTFVCDSGVSVTVYETQDLTGAHVDNATIAYPRSSSTGLVDWSGTGQVNFVVALAGSRELEDVVAAPAENYTNLKDQGNGYYRLTKVTGDVTVTVTAKKCTVTFDANGFGTAPDPQTVFKNDMAVEPSAPSAPGYSFGGWYTDAACTGEAFDFNTPVTEDITLYAKWTENTEPMFVSHQLILSGQIGMHFYMTIPEGLTDGTMTFTVGSRTATASGALQSDGRYKFTCYVNSVEMAETITATYTYTADNETKTVTDSTSVKAYLEVIINNVNGSAAYTAATPLAKAIYNYGYYAMQAVPGGSQHPTMPGTYAGDTTLVTSLDGYAISATLDSAVITAASYSLDLDSETAINFYLTTESELTKDNVSVTAEGATFEYTVEKIGSRYRVQITGIGAHELGTVFTLTTGDTMISASAMTYVQQRLANTNASVETKNAAAALYEYYQQAIGYSN